MAAAQRVRAERVDELLVRRRRIPPRRWSSRRVQSSKLQRGVEPGRDDGEVVHIAQQPGHLEGGRAAVRKIVVPGWISSTARAAARRFSSGSTAGGGKAQLQLPAPRRRRLPRASVALLLQLLQILAGRYLETPSRWLSSETDTSSCSRKT